MYDALDLSGQLLALATRLGGTDLLVEAHFAAYCTNFWFGNLNQVPGHCDKVLQLYDFDKHRTHATTYGQDPAVGALGHCGAAYCVLGYQDKALEMAREALSLARRLQHPFSLGFAFTFACFTHCFRREPDATAKWSKALMELSAEHSFPQHAADAAIFNGCVASERGEDTISEIRKALDFELAIGTELNRPFFLSLLHRALLRFGRTTEATEVIQQALEYTDKAESSWSHSEIIRLLGELHVTDASTAEYDSEKRLLEAITIARDQDAKLLEIHAGISLARLWRDQGKRTEARDLLAPIYDWFTEGFDTPVLKEAKALLKELEY